MNENLNIKHRQGHKRSMIRTEDGLTYNVFNRLSYLSKRNFGRIFNETFSLEVDFEALNELSFWPKWNVKEIDQINNTNFIEPDLFMRFKDVDVIIEAKRYDINQQSEFQWKNQSFAYKSIFQNEKKKLIFVALGGMSFNKSEQSSSVVQSYWFQLAQTCKKQLTKDYLLDYEKRIVKDVMETLNFYDHIPLDFLESLKPLILSTKNFKF